LAVPYRLCPDTLIEAGDALGALAGPNVDRGNVLDETVTVKFALCFAVAEAPTLTVKTSVPGAPPVVNRTLALAAGLRRTEPGVEGIAAQVEPLSIEYSGELPVVAKVPQRKEGAFVPETVNEGVTEVTVFGVVVCVFGDRTNADGTRSTNRLKLLVRVPSVSVPAIVVPSAASPQAPVGPVFHCVVIASVSTTAVEAWVKRPPLTLNSIQPVPVRF
jgi:hypothetical protein